MCLVFRAAPKSSVQPRIPKPKAKPIVKQKQRQRTNASRDATFKKPNEATSKLPVRTSRLPDSMDSTIAESASKQQITKGNTDAARPKQKAHDILAEKVGFLFL